MNDNKELSMEESVAAYEMTMDSIRSVAEAKVAADGSDTVDFNEQEMLYRQYKDEFIKSRTRQEMIIGVLAEGLLKLEKEDVESAKRIAGEFTYPFTLADLVPALYDPELPRKDYAEQIYKCNAMIKRWNKEVAIVGQMAAIVNDTLRKLLRR